MAWPIGPLPPAKGSKYTYYDWVRQFPEAIRERIALVSGGADPEFNWPSSTRVWAAGRISSIADNGDGTLNVNCQVFDAGTHTWISPTWIGARNPGMPSDTKWWTNFNAPHDFPWEPRNYKIAIYKQHTCTSAGDGKPRGSGAEDGHTLDVTDNGAAYVKVTDDGVLTLNGKALSAYGDNSYLFEIIRSGGSRLGQEGYSWHMRFPPKPNVNTQVWGYTGKVLKLDVTDAFTLTVGGHVIQTLGLDVDATTLANAIEAALGGETVAVSGDVANGFTLVFAGSLGDVTVTAAGGAAVHVPANVLGDMARQFGKSLIGLDLIFPVGAKWWRTSVTAVDGHTLTYAALPAARQAAPNVYYAAVAVGGWWRPHFCDHPGFPEFYVNTVRRQTRSGFVDFWEAHTYWCPQTWYATNATTAVESHLPVDDNVYFYNVPAQLVTIEECADELCDCETYVPDGGKEDVVAFDRDFITLAENWCTGYADNLYMPWFHWGLRGWQDDVEGLVTRNVFVEPKDWTGTPKIVPLTPASWLKFFKLGSTRTVSIASVDGSGIAHFGAIVMPQITPKAGNYTSLSDCWYQLKAADGSVKDQGYGVATSTTFTKTTGNFDTFDGTGADSDVGQELIIGFGWQRRYERRVRLIYPRSIFEAEEDDNGDLVNPPVEEYPGLYLTNSPSSNYAEFSDRGELGDTGSAFVEGEAARYTGNLWDEPTGQDAQHDLINQVLPSPTSDFPRFRKNGQATGGGDYFLEDTGNLFWVTANPLITHTGTGTSGSSTTQVHDSTLYRAWLTHTGGGGTAFQTRLSRFWTGVNATRFVGMIMEVAVAGDGTPENLYVWERRPIVAQDVSTPTNPFVTVSPAFSTSASGRPYKIREPGTSARGAILNTFKDRWLVITKKSDGSKHRVKISYSDDTRLYWSQAAGVVAAAQDDYQIDEIDPGSVLQRKSGNANAHNGWVKTGTADATQDTRGANWRTGDVGPLCNCPTIVNAHGRLRKWDVVHVDVFLEIYNGINALRHTKNPMSWTDKGEAGSSWDPEDSGSVQFPANRADYPSKFTAAKNANLFEWHLGSERGTHSPDTSRPWMATNAYATRSGSFTGTDDPFEIGLDINGNHRAYGATTVSNTCFSSAVDFYARALAASGIFGRETIDGPNYGCNNPPYTNDWIIFNDFGSGLTYNAFKKFGSIDPSRAAVRYTNAMFGPSPISIDPVWNQPPDPTTSAQCNQTEQHNWALTGFVVVDEQAVLRWDVPGGLRYVP